MMYPGPFKAAPIGFHYPGHQPAPPFYQNLYAGYNAQYQPYPENSPLTSARPYPLLNDHYGLAQARQSGQHALPGLPQYPPPPSVPFQHHECKGKKNDKRTDLSPTAAVEQNLYSDGEKSSESYSGSQFLALKSPSKREDLNHHDLQQLSHGSKNNKDENCCQGGEERKNSIKIGKRQSRSKLPRQRPHRSAQHQTNGQVDLPAEIKAQVQAIQNGYKQAKRTSRLPHEDNRPAAASHLDQLQSNIYPPYHPYQSHVPHPDYFTSITPYNAFQARANIAGSKNPLEREIHRLRQHIQTLESELHKLQKKVNRSAVSHHRTSNKTDHNSKPKRSKRNCNASPRQTPVIIEMTNSTAGTLRDLPHKKHHRRTRTHGSSHHDKKTIQQSAKIYEENSKSSNHKARSPSPKEEEEINPCDCIHSSGSHVLDSETKHSSSSTQQLRDETAAQLAYAVEARINARPQVPSGQYQFVYQQETSPTQTQQMRESHSSHPQHRTTTDSNYNYSNNNEIITNSEERYNRSAEKILDAFERFYRNIGKTPAAPMKVKYIPEDNNSNHFPHRHMHNHNQYPSMSRDSESPLSVRSNSERVTAQGVKVKTIYSYN